MDEQPSLRRLAPLLLVFAIALLIPVIVRAQGQPPAIPHTVEGRDACLMCHAEGVAGAPQVPDNHEGRPNEVCQACHQTSSTGQSTAVVTAISTVSEPPTVEATPSPTARATPSPLPEIDG